LILPNIADRYRLADTDPWEYAAYKTEDEENTKGFVDTDGYKTATANFLTFRVLKERDFSTVDWPASLI
jgi:hypothetical protein